MKRLIVTEQSYQIRKEKYEKIGQRILEVQRDKEEARSQGDLSENFGYVEAKKTEENLRRMQGDLELDFPLDVVNPKEWAKLDMEDMPRAMLGAEIEIERNGEYEKLLIGGAWDSDLNHPGILSYTSPLAKALIPKAPGFTTTLETNGDKIELLSSKAPSIELLNNLFETEKKTIASPRPSKTKESRGAKEAREAKPQEDPSPL
jgi:transcription elongation GreA/GreB family factor